MRAAFTLIETLVALVLFQIAMLALAATSAVAARELAIAHRSAHARSLAINRLELLRARGCPDVGTGQLARSDGYTEGWNIEADGMRRRIQVTISFAMPRGRTGRVVMRGDTICPS